MKSTTKTPSGRKSARVARGSTKKKAGPLDLARRRAIKSARDFYNAKSKILSSEDLAEKLYWLFGSSHTWADNTFIYRHAIDDLFSALANPALSTVLIKDTGEYSYEVLVSMLHQLRLFCESMEDDFYRSFIDQSMFRAPGLSVTRNAITWFNEHAAKYRLKLAVLKVEQEEK